MNCPICGHQAKENDHFCRLCGALLENGTQNSADLQLEQQNQHFISQPEMQKLNTAPYSKPDNQLHDAQFEKQDKLQTSKVKTKKKKPVLTIVLAILCVLLSAALLLNIFVFPMAQGIREKYFKSPEECCEYFVSQLSDLNFENAMATYATTSKAEKHDLKAYLKRVQGYHYYHTPLPNIAEKAGEIAALKNSAIAQSDFSNLIFDLTIQRNIPEFDKTITRITSAPYNEEILILDHTVQEFEMFFNPEVYVKGLELIQLTSTAELTPYYDFLSNKNYFKNKYDIMQIDGAIEREEFLALLKQGNEYFISGFTVSKYNDKGWQLDSSKPTQLFALIGVNSLHNAISQLEDSKITPDVYFGIITGKIKIDY